MINNYNTAIYNEPLIIHHKLAYDPEIHADWLITCALYIRLYKEELTASKIINEIARARGIKRRAVQYHIQKLAAHGAFEKKGIGKGARYFPIDPAFHYQLKIEKFLQQSKFFKELPSGELLTMINANVERLYHILSNHELQYSSSKSKINDPFAVIHNAFYKKFSPCKRWIAVGADWWEKKIDEKKLKEDKKKKEATELANKEQERREINDFINSLSAKQYKKLKEKAIKKMKSNSGIPKFNVDRMIEFEMFEIGKETR